MRKIITCIATLILGGVLLYSCRAKDSYTAHYSLDFRVNLLNPAFTWQPDYKMFRATIQPSFFMGGSREHPFKLTPLKFGDINLHMIATLQQRILLPETDALTAEVRLTCRKQNMARTYMAISGISEQETIVRSDTAVVTGEDTLWHTVSQTVSIENTPVLQLTIASVGRDSLGCDQSLWLDKVEIYLNGKSIDSYPLRYSILQVEAEDITPLSFADVRPCGDIPELKAKRVVAFGESVHGCRTITQAAVQLLKHQVLNNRCRLILLDLPLEEALAYNRFVHGDERFCRDSLMVDFPTQLSRGLIVNDLLVWLKEYNRSRSDGDKVWLMGMGISADPRVSGMWLFDYCCALRRKSTSPVLDSLMVKVLDYESVLKTLDFVESNMGSLEAALGQQELAILRRYLNVSADMENFSSSSAPILDIFATRILAMDEVMYRNATFLMELLCPEPASVAIYAHAGYVDYLGEAGALGKSFGARMKGLLGNSYSCIGITVGKGKFLTSIVPTVVTPKQASLSPLSAGSMERQALESVSAGYFYLSTSKIPPTFFRTRFAGSPFIEIQPNELSVPTRRMDGIIFIRHGEAAEYNRKKFGKIVNNSTLIMDKYAKKLGKRNAMMQK
jgi:erythromycin esterase-like protein